MITRQDRDALRRCLEQVESDPQWARNFERRKKRDDWLTRAFAACGILQSRNLKLMPWQICPAHSDEHPLDHIHPQFAARKAEARVYADQMRRAGVSIFEPDPAAALSAAGAPQPLHLVEEPSDAT